MSGRTDVAERSSAAPSLHLARRLRTLDRTPRWRAVGAALLAAAAIAGGGYLLASGESAEAPPIAGPTPALTVTVVTPRSVVWPRTLTVSGVVAPWQEASVGTQIGSYQLVEIGANVGDQVRRGQVLARLNPALLRAEEAQLLARYEQAETNSRRAAGLQASGAISDQDVLQFRTEARSAEALLAAKRLELRYTAVRAPDDGVITMRAATLGAVVPAGQELFRMIRQNRLEWRGELTAAQLESVAVGQPVTLKLADGSGASAVVRQTGPAMDDRSRLVLVYADLRPGSRARAGAYVSGQVDLGQSAALAVPADCIVIRDGRSYVMTLDGGAESTVRRRAVVVGRRNGAAVEIVGGLSGRERLVLRGAGFLDDGDVVRVAAPRETGR